MSPLSDPLRMLHAALGWGVAFILATQLITIYNRLVAHNWPAALLDSGGLAGTLLYMGGVTAGFLAYTNRPGVAPAGLAALSGFILVLVYNYSKGKAPWPDRLLVSLMESLESVFSDFVHTLSFMRIAAFSISHVALALAIATLSEDMGSAGRILTLVLGNALILVLEGGIVTIQVLRLEYYEGFSRYFTCFGREFTPMLKERAGVSGKNSAG
jgi:V/A-type H+-transporting ATPase subunit I